ncbi:MAG: hypothetical protein NZM03_07050 [Limisphaera sp.]|nr:hypothetical protein [Limisphaera sp.]
MNAMVEKACTVQGVSGRVTAGYVLRMAIALHGFLMHVSAIGQTCTVTGELEAIYHDRAGKPVGRQTTKFTVSVGSGRWLLKSEYDPEWFWLVGCDGVNTYSVLVDPKARHLPAPATVFPGAFPRAAFDTVSVPWLAYCSFGFLENPTNRNRIPLLWLQPQLDPLAHVCSTTVKQFREPPYLPEEVEWRTSADAIASAASNPMLRIEGASPEELARRQIDYKTAIATNKVLGKYRVLASTNVSGQTLPLTFELEGYGYLSPDQRERILSAVGMSLPETFLNVRYLGRALAISHVPEPPTLPDPSMPLSVSDYRLACREDGIEYVSYQARRWKEKVDEDLVRLSEQKRRSPSKQSSQYIGSSGMQSISRGVIFMVLLMPLLVWAARRIRKKARKHNSHGS